MTATAMGSPRGAMQFQGDVPVADVQGDGPVPLIASGSRPRRSRGVSTLGVIGFAIVVGLGGPGAGRPGAAAGLGPSGAGPRGAEFRQRALPRPPIRAGGRGVRAVLEGGGTRPRRRRGPVRPGQLPGSSRGSTTRRAGISRTSSRRPPVMPTPRRPGIGSARPRTCSATWPAARQALETFTAGNPGHRYLETAWPYLGDVCFRLGDLAAGASRVRAVAGTPSQGAPGRSRAVRAGPDPGPARATRTRP